MYTLREWQKIVKPENELIVQASKEDGSDGITNSSIGMCFHYVYQKNNYEKCQIGPHDQIVLCSIADHTDFYRRNNCINRKTILSTLQKNGIQNISINPRDYYITLPLYKFVISPEGNGIDCHRHYESLLAGSIPIIEEGNKELIIKKYGENMPILYTKDYSEITYEYLNDIYEQYLDKVYDFSKLFLSTWDDDEQRLIKMRGNYWCKRLTNHYWY